MDSVSLVCDSCGNPIEEVSHGWVEWLCERIDENKDRFRYINFRVVHKDSRIGNKYPTCQSREAKAPGPYLMDNALEHFIGPRGLMTFLEYLANRDVDHEEVIEIIKRLQIPGYEQVRQHIPEAISLGIYEPNRHEDFPNPSSIENMLEWLEQK